MKIMLLSFASGFLIGLAYWSIWLALAKKILKNLIKKDFSEANKNQLNYAPLTAALLRYAAVFGCISGALKLFKLSALPLCLGIVCACIVGRIFIVKSCGASHADK